MQLTKRIALVTSFIAAATVSLADNTLTFQGLSLGGGTDTASINGGGYYAGPFDVTLNSGPTFRTFCADINDETVFNTPTTVTLQNTDTMGASFERAAQIYNAFSGTVGNNALENAGLQVAIWKVLFPSNTYGDFWQPGVIAQANVYLNANTSSYSDQATYYNFGGHNQGQIGAVPEPATYAVLGLGMIGLIRRRAKKA